MNSFQLLQVREGAYGVLLREEQILLCHTKSGSRIIINFPGGAIDAGETAEQTVIREVKEETGSKVKIIRHLYSSDGNYFNPDYPSNRLKCHYYLIEAITAINLYGNSDDVNACEWFELSKLPYDRMLEVDIEFCKILKQLL